MKNVFDSNDTQKMIERVNTLTVDSKPHWGSMSVSQMLAHVNVTYELDFDNKHPKPGFVMGFILKTFIKKMVVNDTPYKQSLKTAPYFLVSDDKEFEHEKSRLIDHIKRVQELGEAHYDNRESHSFGTLSKTEWNNMFYKHFDHHMAQFGV